MYDVVVIGSGPAGMTAAIYAKRANLNVLILDKLAPGGQILNTYEIENYPGFFRINGADLGIKIFEHTQSLGILFEYGTVESIEIDENVKTIKCAEGNQYNSKAIIIATGTKPKILNIENEKKFLGNGISFCAICDGAHYQNKDVIIIGGGNSAVEEAIFLSAIVNKVKLVTLYKLTADDQSCDKLRKLSNVDIYEYCDVLKFNEKKDRFCGINVRFTKTNEEISLDAHGAFEYIGFEPMSQFAQNLGICNTNGYILVNNQMETSIQGVFSAGDVIDKKIRQVVTACNDGAIAAQYVSKYIRKSQN